MYLSFTMSDPETAKAKIAAAGNLVTSQHGKQAAGDALRQVVVSHLEGLGPNKRFPAASTGFYKEAAESTSAPEIEGDRVVVSIVKLGMRQRLLGGRIAQNNPGKTYLTIPNEAYGYGRLAPEFSGLKFAFARNEEGYLQPALVATDLLALSGAKRRKKGQRPVLEVGDVVYWLVKSVYQEPDPSILPTNEQMTTAVVDKLTDLVRSWINDPNAEVLLS